MANKIRKIRRRKAPKQKKEPNILERLKKLSDSAPVTRMPDKSFVFYDIREEKESNDK